MLCKWDGSIGGGGGGGVRVCVWGGVSVLQTVCCWGVDFEIQIVHGRGGGEGSPKK